jgi:ATP-binding cassette subfamily B protein
MPKSGNEGKVAKRLLKDLFSRYKVQLILVFILLIFTSISNVTGSLFTPRIINDVIKPVVSPEEGVMALTFADVSELLLQLIITMGTLYLIGIISSLLYTRIMATVTQHFLNDMREKTFAHMQTLPIKYFDRRTHGDIMSVYTNDIDAIRQLVGGSIPNLIHSAMIIIGLVFIMFSYSIWLSLVVFLGVILMFFTTKYVGGNSGKYFMMQQRTLGKLEGYVEEMMHGAKVVKVFCHEDETKKEFDEINEQLRKDVTRANSFGNILGPIMGNIGNLMYVLLAVLGTIIYLSKKAINLSFTGLGVLEVGNAVAFLQMSRQFTQNVNSASMQINSIVMGLAGAERVYNLLDEESETDEGYVTLVNAKYDEEGNLTETTERTGIWAWKHPHKADGSITYELLRGDIRMFDVDFGYNPEKIVLHDVTLYAEPGQKVAFVGATGAGKTTITNLINRFYDIADGKVRYDGININKIKKSDLRRSLGIVLQDTNLFTGTVRENIRYGKLDATDEEIIKAAKIANAYDFIMRLPHGFDTMLESDGANLSQGQRQLLSIARAAVADAPVMILDEATSSIDTRTELLVQKGTDQLMHGRTVFVIAHRLSTVQNSDVIMVLEKGRIIERGSHNELIAKRGQYYQLYTGAFELE